MRSGRFSSKILTPSLLILMTVSAASASPQQSPFGMQPGTRASGGGGPRLGEALDRLRGFRQKALNLDSAATDLIFPVLGKIPSWSSDLMLINYRATPQKMLIFFLELGQNNVNAAPWTYTLPANQMTYWHDFFGTGLQIDGIGSILFIPVDSQDDPDGNARIDGSARLYQTAGNGGTLAQLFPGVPIHDAPTGARTTATGLRSDSHFRTNAGVVNLDSIAHNFTVSIVAGTVSTFNISVPPYSMNQVRIPGDGSYGDIALQFTSDSGTWWSSYGACVDNISGDSWSSHGALAY